MIYSWSQPRPKEQGLLRFHVGPSSLTTGGPKLLYAFALLRQGRHVDGGLHQVRTLATRGVQWAKAAAHMYTRLLCLVMSVKGHFVLMPFSFFRKRNNLNLKACSSYCTPRGGCSSGTTPSLACWAAELPRTTRREHHLRSPPRAVQPHACARRVTRRSPQSISRSSGE